MTESRLFANYCSLTDGKKDFVSYGLLGCSKYMLKVNAILMGFIDKHGFRFLFAIEINCSPKVKPYSVVVIDCLSTVISYFMCLCLDSDD